MKLRHSDQRGMGVFGLLLFFIIFLILIFILLAGYSKLSEKCIGDEIISCALDVALGKQEEVKPPEDAVTATGTIAREFKGNEYSVEVSLSFSPEGGVVTGSFSGDCDGSIRGTYSSETGAMSGDAKGSCAMVIPASGTFTGTVNKSSNHVVLTGSGSAAGFASEGSLTLTY